VTEPGDDEGWFRPLLSSGSRASSPQGRVNVPRGWAGYKGIILLQRAGKAICFVARGTLPGVHQVRGQSKPRIPRSGRSSASRQRGRRGAWSGQAKAVRGPAKRLGGADDEGCARRRRLRGPDRRSGLESAADLDRERAVSWWRASDAERQRAPVDPPGLVAVVSPDARRARRSRLVRVREGGALPARSKSTGGECACESCWLQSRTDRAGPKEGLSARVAPNGV